MRFFDTRTKDFVDFTPEHKKVTMYVCGITPYDSAHLGHIFTFMTYDLLQRRLEDLGYEVQVVRNITDVDEPIFAKASENNEHYTELARREIESFQEIMRTLNFREPDTEPLASDYITEMAAAVERLLKTGNAYRLDNDIYFDVSTFPSFGSFSGLPEKLALSFMRERGGDPERPGKRHPLDFLLWRGITDSNDPAAWESPVGYGRPGWHIECSVMSSHLLNTPIDIHGGGMDLIFPHHECELTQSESLGQKPFVKNWLHVAPLLLDGEKMSKSLGNLIFAQDLLKVASPAAVRLVMLNYHYRLGGEWRREWWHEALDTEKQMQLLLDAPDTKRITGLPAKVRNALDDNLDTPAVLAAIRSHTATGGSTSELKDALNLVGIAV